MALADKTFVGGTIGTNDLRATNDTDGSYLFARGGDDTLRGGRFDDVLEGGAGNDAYFGGGGADQFRFNGATIEGASDKDFVRDLTFTDNDTLVFNNFANGIFSDDTGVNAVANGTGAIISSYAGIVNAVEHSGGLITAERFGTTDSLVLSVNNGMGQIEHVQISDGWNAYMAALAADGTLSA
jgi:Ca2+-binding RTX toxin-like protein